MSDTYDTGVSGGSLPPLTAAIIAAQPKTLAGNLIGPAASDKALRAMLDAIHSLEQRLITAGI
jgi:hypothetical protein